MKEALFYQAKDNSKAQCLLCPHNCLIPEGKVGLCGVRRNQKGKLYSLVYEQATSVALDPIEKKPLYHFHPKEFILSVGTKGCNLSCMFCQNWAISKDLGAATETVTSQFLVERAKKLNSFGIAYTYNEPFIWYEFVLDTARLAKKEGLKNVLVTNGYVNIEPLKNILPFIDAMNIDIKSIEEEFYINTCAAKLSPVLETIKQSAKNCHIELTNLIIPTLNDSEDNFVKLRDWIYENLGDSVPLHFSRYFPCYKLNLPATPVSTLEKAQYIAEKKLKFVYLGNV
ncbi:MAG: AmmeMemoRadiSam system radical SAM enzyme [Candidatus Omnitrophica bacterium]|nr:AmmeMemoRadiSam system radical SAM enzyme [Candidatus Omnitrophota bacterium]